MSTMARSTSLMLGEDLLKPMNNAADTNIHKVSDFLHFNGVRSGMINAWLLKLIRTRGTDTTTLHNSS
jgi:hypothetical protein